MKLTLKHAIVVFGILPILAACGGGGGGTPSTDSGPTLEERQTEQRDAIKTAIGKAETAVAAVKDDSADSVVGAADAAITEARNAITAAKDVPDAEKTANTGTVNALASRLTAAKADRKTAMDNAKALADKEMTMKARALKKAIMAGAGVTDATMTGIPAITVGADQTDAITLKAGDSAGSLGSWKGMNYAGMIGSGDDKTTGTARYYSNSDAAKRVPFVGEAGEAVHGLTQATANDGKDVYSLGTDADEDIGGSKFPTTGTKTYDVDERKFAGTYMGASGTYQCTAGACTAAFSDDGITLAGTWTFTPSPGAMLQMKDASYVYFGWWIRHDKDGPTHAGVHYGGSSGTGGATLVDETRIGTAALVGKATYTGKSAGKFAVSDPLNPGNDNAGHFTADAELMADFKATAAASTLSGTIDNFRLNNGSSDPGWSIALQKTAFDGTDDKFKTASSPDGDQTVWSIGGAKTPASGMWEARMFDDKAGDGSNVPDSVVGSFMSKIGVTHEMVGAFGAEKD
ncbi:MAG: hypothetical protein OXI81_01315 [Paracoccaceae bacterium]|nr:hypothetical protein [Paracoccaceae bacterium]